MNDLVREGASGVRPWIVSGTIGFLLFSNACMISPKYQSLAVPSLAMLLCQAHGYAQLGRSHHAPAQPPQ